MQPTGNRPFVWVLTLCQCAILREYSQKQKPVCAKEHSVAAVVATLDREGCVSKATHIGYKLLAEGNSRAPSLLQKDTGSFS